MKLSGDWIEAPNVQRVLAMLTDAGHQAYLVGGCVRNGALGQPVSDIDIATDALPERVEALARAAGFHPVPTGIEHGTVTVIAQNIPHEITTFRRDVETDGRHAVIAFSRDIAEDAARRDFTMNALYARADGTVLDPLGAGLADLAARRLRFVGQAQDRIREDYLRILRFFRFTAWYGDPQSGPDPEGLAACAALAEGLDGLARERVGAEMRKLLAAPDPAPVLATMQACGVLARLLPGADTRALSVLVHLEHSADPAIPAEALRRLAALRAGPASAELRLSRQQAKHLAALGQAVESGEDGAALAYRHGAEIARDALLLRAAALGMPLPAQWQDQIAHGAAQSFPLSAQDLMPRFRGQALGQALKTCEERWIASDFRLGRAELLAQL